MAINQNNGEFQYAVVKEMELVCYTLGKTALRDISVSDLCALDPFVAKSTGVEFGMLAPDEQETLWKDFVGPMPSIDRMPEQPETSPLHH